MDLTQELTTYPVRSDQIRSNRIESNRIESNRIESNQIIRSWIFHADTLLLLMESSLRMYSSVMITSGWSVLSSKSMYGHTQSPRKLMKRWERKQNVPLRGIEPRPRPWKGHILTDRLEGILLCVRGKYSAIYTAVYGIRNNHNTLLIYWYDTLHTHHYIIVILFLPA